jgi:hypothetical protein
VHGDRDADSRIRPRELLEDEDVGEKVRAGSPVLLGDADAHEPEVGELRQQLVGEAVLAVPFRRLWGDLALGNLARKHLDRPLLGRELEVHCR